MGGFTLQVRQPDSWEGWYWGSKHVWGHGFQGMMAPQLNVVQGRRRALRHGPQVGLRRRDHAVGLHRAERHQHLLLLHRGRHQAGLHLPRAQLRRGRPRRQVDPDPPQHRRRPAAGHHLRVAQGRHLGQGVRATHAVGMDKVAAYVLGEEDGVPKTPEWASKKTAIPEWTIKALAREFAQEVHLDPALLRRLDGPRPVLARARPARVHPARHAGPRRPRRAPVAVLVLRHAARRGARELPLLQPDAERRPAHPGAQQRRRLGHAEHPQDAHPGGHPQQRRPSTSPAPARRTPRPRTSSSTTSSRTRRKRAAAAST